jgi:hypothetical protein
MIICDRAKRRGVQNADFLVIRRTVTKGARSVFDPQEFDEFVESLELKTGFQVIQIIHDQDD